MLSGLDFVKKSILWKYQLDAFTRSVSRRVSVTRNCMELIWCGTFHSSLSLQWLLCLWQPYFNEIQPNQCDQVFWRKNCKLLVKNRQICCHNKSTFFKPQNVYIKASSQTPKYLYQKQFYKKKCIHQGLEFTVLYGQYSEF